MLLENSEPTVVQLKQNQRATQQTAKVEKNRALEELRKTKASHDVRRLWRALEILR
jgi:hypothetical protein